MSTILIIGASRGIGLETVKAGLAGGHHVKALARHASKIGINDSALEKIDGDACDREDIASALDHADIVIQSLGVRFSPDVALSGTKLFSTATRVLVDAMTERGPKRLIVVTGLGAGDSRGHGGFLYDALFFPLVLKRIYDDKDVQEQIIRSSNLDWTIVRPGILRDGPPTGLVQAFNEPKDWRAAPIRRADVGQFLVEEAEKGNYIGKTPLVISP